MATNEEILKADALAAEAEKNAAPTVSRTDTINQMYDAQKQNQLSQLETAYNLNKSNMQASADKIPQMYQTKANDLNAQYEKNKRNFNMQAAATGVNTGTASQAELAQNAAYLKNYGNLRTAEADAATEAQRNLDNLEMQYQASISQALASNDYNRAAALLDEYNNQYTRDLDKAKILAQYGDFSGYAPLYGKDVAQGMANMWYVQNPDLAYRMGVITEAQKNNINAGRPINYGLDENGNVIAGAAIGGGGGSGDGGYLLNLGASKFENALNSGASNQELNNIADAWGLSNETINIIGSAYGR